MRPKKLTASILAAAAAATGVALAGDDATSLSYISYLERYATVQAAESKDSIDAVVNMPVITGDRIDTARGARVEVQLADGSTLWLDEFTTLDFDALAASRESPAQRTVLYLQEGTLAIEIPASALGDGTTRLDFKGGTLYLSRPGLYRFDLRTGQLHVETHAGLAELPAGLGSVLLRNGQEAVIDGSADVRKASLAVQADDFWSWVDERRHPDAGARTAEVVGTDTAGRAAVLDSYGSWVYVDAYGSWAWRPYVQVGWTPYSSGRWYWTPVGWNWISYEPWGWYPYHYGSWYLDASFGWVWCWDWVWGPAWVHWIYTPGYIGWCPRGYYDWWYHDHGYHSAGDWHGGPGGPGGPAHGAHDPGRWGTAYDFSGRVRLKDVDPRPWNIVPADQFTNSRIDRVRLDPGRVLRDAGNDARGVVRSGPLVTRPSRGDVERNLAGDFRDAPGGRTVPALDRVLGRDDSAPSSPADSSVMRPVRTRDLVSVGARPWSGEGAADAGGTQRVAVPSWSSHRSSGPIVDVSGPSGRRSSGGSVEPDATNNGAGSGGAAAESSRPAPSRDSSSGTTAPRSGPSREPAAAAPREPRSREVQPAPAKPQQAPAQAPPSRSLGYTERIRSFERHLIDGRTGVAGQEGARTQTWVVNTSRGDRFVQITGGESGGAGASAGRAAAPRAATVPGARYYAPRPPAAEAGRSGSVTPAPRSLSPTGRSETGHATAPRSYQPSPSAAPAPRAISPSSSSAPRAAAPSRGGSFRAAPSSAHSGSGGSRPHGRH